MAGGPTDGTRCRRPPEPEPRGRRNIRSHVSGHCGVYVGAERHGRHRPTRAVPDGQVGATTAQRPATAGGQQHVGIGSGGRERPLARPGWWHDRTSNSTGADDRRRWTAAATATALPAQSQRVASYRRVATAVGRKLHRRHGSEHG